VHRDGQWVYANPSALKLLGAKYFGEIVNLPIMNFVHPDYRNMVLHRIEKMEETNQSMAIVEEKFIRLNGEVFTVEVGSRPIIFDGKASYMITFRDISKLKRYEDEQKSLQQQLEHAQRLESLGVMAGGIAHDFNNLLAAITGNAELLKDEVKDVAGAQPYMHNIDESCGHAADLCRQMLAYAGKGSYSLEAIDVNALMQSMGRLIRASVSSSVSLKVKLDSQLPMIEGDISQIKQIILNFIVNSADAIGSAEGEIKLSTYTTLVDRTLMSKIYNGLNLSEGKYTVLEVKDNGPGISKAIQEKIFDPFFTTKGTGSGLGLSAVLGIVRAHHGAVQLESEPGKGTMFRVFLPISSQSEPAHVIQTSELNAWKGDGLVLIVDDDETVRKVVKAFMTKFGFETIIATDGREGAD